MKKIIVLALSLIMVFSFATTSLAVISPSGEDEFTIRIYYVSDIDGTSAYQYYRAIPEGDGYRLLIDDEYLNYFVKWIIDGEYEIVEGSLTDPEIVIRPKSDITAYAHVNSTIPPAKDKGDKSPDTSASPVAGLVAVMAVAGLVAVVAKKKISD